MIIRTIATLIMAVLICSFEISAFADSESATQEHYKKQFEIIMNYESFWSTKDDTEQYWYTVTDLDHNGCLEIVSAVNYSTGNLTHIEAYEVSTSTQSTKRLWLW